MQPIKIMDAGQNTSGMTERIYECNMIDLHLHTTHSDGVLSPAALIELAAESGCTLAAIADHDSVSAIDQAVAAAQPYSIRVIPAVELSVIYRHYADIHLLGYGINHHDSSFNEKLSLFRNRRDTRSEAIVERINQRLSRRRVGSISYSDVTALADGAVGRPHIARVLIENGLASSMEEAFNDFLIPCNVPKEYFPLDEAINEIHRIGGLAVLAHPTSITKDLTHLLELVEKFKIMGLDGIEAYHNMLSEDETEKLLKYADAANLLVTGGSDFHGIEDYEKIGYIRENIPIPDSILKRLAERLNLAF